MATPPPTATAVISALLRATANANANANANATGAGTNTTDGIGSTSVAHAPTPSGTDVLRTSITIYFPLLALAWVAFEILRRRDGHIFERVNHFSMPLHHCIGGWIPQLFSISDQEIVQRCGLDAWVFLRFVRLSQKIAATAVFCSFALFPLYLSGESHHLPMDKDDDGVPLPRRSLDSFDRLSIANVDKVGRWRLWFAVLTAYAVSWLVLVLVKAEYKAYMRCRHDFMGALGAQQYSIVVTDLPRRLRRAQPLRAYLDYLFPSAIHNVYVGVECTGLETLLEEREKLQSLHDGAAAKFGADGNSMSSQRPQLTINRRFLCCGGTKVDEIEYYGRQLQEIDAAIQAERTAISEPQHEERTANDKTPAYGAANPRLQDISVANDQDDRMDEREADRSSLSKTVLTRDSTGESDRLLSSASFGLDSIKGSKRSHRRPSDLAKFVVESVTGKPLGKETAIMRSAAFVSFRSLRSTYAALQQLQTENPAKLRINAAPHLHDIVWENFGLPHKLQSSWHLISACLTFVIVCFWTIPTAFVTSLANVEKLRVAYPSLGSLIVGHPLIQKSLEQVAPVLLSIMNAVAHAIFKFLATREGHLSVAEVQASAFTKLCYFQVFQMFFVSAVTGSIIAAMMAIVDAPTRVLYFLGSSIASQSMLFVTFIIVQLCVSLPMRWLRVVPLIQDTLHRLLAPSYAQYPERKPWLGLMPLNFESDIDPAFELAQQFLIFLLVLVFAPIAPIVSYVGLLFFLCAEVVYRRHYFFVNDAKWAVINSTGAFWPRLFSFIVGALVVAQATLIGLLSLKSANMYQLFTAAMLPFATFVFHWSITTQCGYPDASRFLPLDRCCDLDEERKNNSFDFLDGVYRQPAMAKVLSLPPSSTQQ